MTRHCSGLLLALAAALAAPPAAADEEEVTLVGVFGSKAAILSIGGAAPKTVKVGQKLGGLTLVSVEGDRATIEVGGTRRVLRRGQTWSSSAGSDRQSATLAADGAGHFVAEGQINGGAIRFLVDTGASTVAIPAAEATRLRIDYRKGRRGMTQTANGAAPVYVVRLDSVRVGGIELREIDAMVFEQGLTVPLLGMSFLSRVEMRHEGQTMTLIRRY